MAKFETHIGVGMIVAVAYMIVDVIISKGKQFDPFVHLIGFITISLYSILPDMDQPSSKPRKIFLILGFLIITFLAVLKEYLLIIIISLAFILVIFGSKHRGIMHSYSFGFIVSFPLLFYDWRISCFSYLSFISHLLLDSQTKNNKFPY